MSKPCSGRNSPDPQGSSESVSLAVPSLSQLNASGALSADPIAQQAEPRPLRSNSPTQLPTELKIKYQTQINRVTYMEEIASAVPEDASTSNLSDIQSELEQLEECHREFTAEHTHFELTWPAACLTDTYFAENVHQREARLFRRTKLALGKLKHALTGALEISTGQLTAASNFESKLPDISLPKFSGDYAEWPAFREMFTCLILENQRLSIVERLHYLRGCMEGSPAQLISSFPLIGSSLQPSWELLITRYENKRLLIQAQLDKLCHLTQLTSKSARGLNTLISTVSEANKALESLGVTQNLGDHMLTYHVSRHLDRSTREAWETSLGSSSEYPKFEQLEAFINARARALERIESSALNTQPEKSTQPKLNSTQLARKSIAAHQASVAERSTQQRIETSHSEQFQCDCCEGNHFIVRALMQVNKELQALLSASSNNAAPLNTTINSTGNNKSNSTRGSTIHLIRTSLRAIAHVNSPLTTHQARLLIDPGSELTFVSENLIRQLKIKRQHSSVDIIGIGGTKTTQTRGVVSLTLRSTHTADVVKIYAHILDTVSSQIPSFHAPPHSWPHIAKLRLADPEFLEPRAVDIIIGADSYGQVIKPNIIRHSPSVPIAQLSIFGWLVLGPVHSSYSASCTSHHVITQPSDAGLQELLTRFWVQEELPADAASTLTPEDQECENHFRTTHSRDSTGRYIVRIPLKSPPSLLGKSYATAHHCLQRVLKRLKRDDQYGKLYTDFMKEYEELGHMVRAHDNSLSITHSRELSVGGLAGGMTLAPDALQPSGGSRVSSGGSSSETASHRVYYLPHHGVLRPDRTTTKLRVVFNGSSPTSSGHSINDLMHTGPNLLSDISEVLIWIRHHHHIFATDITKMYRQIKVHKDDWDLQRILWVDGQLNEVPYQLTTVTYGTKAAPYLAVRTLLQAAKDEGHRFPLALPSLKHRRYVDDIFGGADSVEQLIKIACELIGLCNAGGFPIAKWHSTNEDLLKAIAPEQPLHSPISFDDCATSILGLKWLPQAHSFGFTSKFTEQTRPITKRLILSEVAQIFDPLGFISPVVIRAKMLLQELWLHKLSWDDSLPSQFSSRWLILREDLKDLAKISIPRWFNTWSDSTVELHGFSDASHLAMSAVVYIVVHSPSTGATSSLVCAKTKVAPLKPLTIPRLELTAALLLARLIQHTQSTFKLQIESTHLWTDSQVTLTWIKAPASRWKDYVRNRVTQIQELTTHAHWRLVPGTSNPADGPSRGLTTQQLKDHSLWWTGPPWLTKSQDSWPRQTTLLDDFSAHEVRPGISLHVAAPQVDYHWDLIYQYSSLHKLLKLTAICLKIAAKWRKVLDSSLITTLSSADIQAAKLFWVKATQAAYFSHELNILKSNSTLPKTHAFSRLTAFLDHEGVIRVGGRLNLSALTQEGKHPAILPRQSRLSSLIIDRAHKRTLHGGTQLTLADTRQEYWILGGRSPVKTHILRCISCARQRGIRAQQLMGQLPLSRVTPSRPFTHTGVDYAGPLTLKTWKGRGAKSSKGWICVFVCLTTSAVHLEAVSDYSADGFIATYRRFSSRRGIPHSLYSDCGTNFIGADTKLRRLFIKTTQEHHSIASILSQDSTQWQFNPPAAPHMGGKWEAVVKSIKFHLNRTVGETSLTFEELSTLLSQIEGVLNSRPLEPLSDDPDDVSALTPGHFLTGSALSSLPEPSLRDIALSRLSRWQLIQQKLQSFWTQWQSHYLQRQQSISKWHHRSNNINVGSLVLITDERFPPSKWPLARVTALHPGKDGLTRVVTLKTATTTLTRPIAKLALLPTQTQD